MKPTRTCEVPLLKPLAVEDFATYFHAACMIASHFNGKFGWPSGCAAAVGRAISSCPLPVARLRRLDIAIFAASPTKRPQ